MNLLSFECMDRRKIANTIATVMLLMMVVLVIGDCTSDDSMTNGSISIGLDNLKWVQILISLGIGFLLGYVFNYLLFLRRK
jgi:hypothetical protein